MFIMYQICFINITLSTCDSLSSNILLICIQIIWLVDILRIIYLIRARGKRYRVRINFSYIWWGEWREFGRKVHLERNINWTLKNKKELSDTNRIKFRVSDPASNMLASGLAAISRRDQSRDDTLYLIQRQ